MCHWNKMHVFLYIHVNKEYTRRLPLILLRIISNNVIMWILFHFGVDGDMRENEWASTVHTPTYWCWPFRVNVHNNGRMKQYRHDKCYVASKAKERMVGASIDVEAYFKYRHLHPPSRGCFFSTRNSQLAGHFLQGQKLLGLSSLTIIYYLLISTWRWGVLLQGTDTFSGASLPPRRKEKRQPLFKTWYISHFTR